MSDFKTAIGSLGPLLEQSPEAARLFLSAGPVSDAYIESVGVMDLINGPLGSGKTTASIKRALLAATRMQPIDGQRRYVLGVWRHKYDALWKGTIPSWRRILDPDKGIGTWAGSSPRAAEHKIRFRDAYGEIEFIARFMAFGEAMGPEDLKSIEFTDCYLNEMDTIDEQAVETLIGRVGRDPPMGQTRRKGRIFGDCNAPSINAWVYRDFFSQKKEGHQLFRQPGGRDPAAENISSLGMSRAYYDNQAMLNAHKPWWVRAFVDNQPGYQRDADVVFPEFDDARMVSTTPLEPVASLPVLVGVDGGLTMSAVYMQEMPDGQVRILHEIAPERADERALADMMLAVETRRFRGCEFYTVIDPACDAGEDTDVGSVRTRLSRHLGRPVHRARTNDVLKRHADLRAPMLRTMTGGRPGLLLDGPNCPMLREGLNQGYVWHTKAGSGERSSVKDNKYTHAMDSAQYAVMETGSAHARHRQSELQQARRAKRAGRAAGAAAPPRFNPLARR